MKLFLLICTLFFANLPLEAQENTVQVLPPGKYETRIKDFKWEKGDIELIDAATYRITTSNETGEYRFSVTAQRLFFTSGPLKGIYAKTQLVNRAPTILIPLNENQQLGFRLGTGDIVGRLRN